MLWQLQQFAGRYVTGFLVKDQILIAGYIDTDKSTLFQQACCAYLRPPLAIVYIFIYM